MLGSYTLKKGYFWNKKTHRYVTEKIISYKIYIITSKVLIFKNWETSQKWHNNKYTDVDGLYERISFLAFFRVSLFTEKAIENYFPGDDKRHPGKFKSSIFDILRIAPIYCMTYIISKMSYETVKLTQMKY